VAHSARRRLRARPIVARTPGDEVRALHPGAPEPERTPSLFYDHARLEVEIVEHVCVVVLYKYLLGLILGYYRAKSVATGRRLVSHHAVDRHLNLTFLHDIGDTVVVGYDQIYIAGIEFDPGSVIIRYRDIRGW
jgi:hypothetical protein